MAKTLPKLFLSGFLIRDINKAAAVITAAETLPAVAAPSPTPIPATKNKLQGALQTIKSLPWHKVINVGRGYWPFRVIKMALELLPNVLPEEQNLAKKQEYAKLIAQELAKQTAKAEEAARLTREKAERKRAMKLIVAGTIVSLVATITQARCKYTGLDTPGRIVGAVGNIIYGAMVGYAVTGIEGAIAGAALGWLLWGVGQFIRCSSS